MPLQRARIDSFPLGIDQSLTPENIPDGALSDALNKVLNERKQPETRFGTSNLGGGFGATNRITSVYDFHDVDGNVVLVTISSRVSTFPPGGGTENILAGVTLPDDTLWQWVTFDNIAIGVNRGTGAVDNPIKVTNTVTPAAAPLGGSPPQGRYIEAWNSRVFIIPEDEPYTIRWSALGNAEDWTTTGRAGAGAQQFSDENYGEIRGIKAQKTRLVIFREKSIEILVPGSPNVDSDQWEFQTLSTSVGCISAYSIQPVLGDLVFASNHGLASLSAVEKFGDFENAILSQRIPDLRFLNVSRDSFHSVVNSKDSQYWISIPSDITGIANELVWVLDFSSGLSPDSPLMKCDGGVVGASYGIVEDAGEPRVYIGGEAGTRLLRYGDGFNDNGAIYVKFLETKHFDLDEPIQRKDFYKLLLSFLINSSSTSIDITWFIDGMKASGKTITATFAGPQVEGLIWDEGVWGDNWSGLQDEAGAFFISSLRGGPGRRGVTLGVRLFNDNLDESFTLDTFSLQFAPLNERLI